MLLGFMSPPVTAFGRLRDNRRNKVVAAFRCSCFPRRPPTEKQNCMGSIKKRRKAKIAKHKRKKRMKENRHKKRLRYKS
jgi:hypothetical protein